MKPEILAIVCARLSSKRAPRKNIAMVGGKPLLCYTVAAALGAKSVSRVIVSTESHEVAQIAYDCGAEVPFMRPLPLAEDHVQPPRVCLHALRWLSEHEGYHPDYLINLAATSPLRTSADIDGIVRMAQEKNADAIFSVYPTEHRYTLVELTLGPDGRVTEILRRNVLSQGECHPLYNPGGGMSVIRTEVFKQVRSFQPTGGFGYIMPIERSLDVDLPWHLYLADLILNDIS